jgi:hypothetical protein
VAISSRHTSGSTRQRDSPGCSKASDDQRRHFEDDRNRETDVLDGQDDHESAAISQ